MNKLSEVLPEKTDDVVIDLTSEDMLKLENIALKKANLQLQMRHVDLQKSAVISDIIRRAGGDDTWDILFHPKDPTRAILKNPGVNDGRLEHDEGNGDTDE